MSRNRRILIQKSTKLKHEKSYSSRSPNSHRIVITRMPDCNEKIRPKSERNKDIQTWDESETTNHGAFNRSPAPSRKTPINESSLTVSHRSAHSQVAGNLIKAHIIHPRHREPCSLRSLYNNKKKERERRQKATEKQKEKEKPSTRHRIRNKTKKNKNRKRAGERVCFPFPIPFHLSTLGSITIFQLGIEPKFSSVLTAARFPSRNATTPRHRRKQIHFTKHRNTRGDRGRE